MIPFENTWPYEKMMKEIYFSTCPFCNADNVSLPYKQKDIEDIKRGVKKRLVLPCCYENVKIIDADEDYFLMDRKVR